MEVLSKNFTGGTVQKQACLHRSPLVHYIKSSKDDWNKVVNSC